VRGDFVEASRQEILFTHDKDEVILTQYVAAQVESDGRV
jgi:hypothetical protein